MPDILTDPRFFPGPESPAWASAMGDADHAAERTIAYREFVNSKRPQKHAHGFIVPLSDLHEKQLDFQKAVTRLSLRRGRSAIWGGTGVGKTIMFLEWARHVHAKTRKPVLVYSPLAVALQSVHEEAPKFGYKAKYCKSVEDIIDGINVTNYERLERFPDPKLFSGVILDESSILKSYTGAFTQAITEWASGIQYRLCCSATPAPNDHIEIGTHAEFLGVMKRTEMLATFFIHDGGKTQDWRLKGHAEDAFWEWVAKWAVAFQRPSHIGFSDDGFDLPELTIETIVVQSPTPDGYLFAVEASGLTEERQAKRESLDERVATVSELVASLGDEPCIIWGQLNPETEAFTEAIPGSVEVTGSDNPDLKQERLLGFAQRKFRDLVTKVKIAGFGMNYQHCRNMIFGGIDNSYESFFQAVRRCWRFGQTMPVRVWVLLSEAERGVLRNLQRKEKLAEEMMEGMIRHMQAEMQRELHEEEQPEKAPIRRKESGEDWGLVLGDCVEELIHVPDGQVDYSIFSPPFSSLYVYSATEYDMGNCRSDADFAKHFEFLVPELYRVLKPGRLVSFHCMNLPTSKERDGYIGIKDFRGNLIRLFERYGFVYHSEVVIWKDPVTAMQRTKALGLLHKQLKKDSGMSRQGLPDYLVTMRKPGNNPKRIAGLLESFTGDIEPEEFEQLCRAAYSEQAEPTEDPMSYEEFKSIFIWQRYASPVWMDINPSDTLQKDSAREDKDERHIAPLQLQVIQRALQLWSNQGDLVMSPFAGIGSEGYVAIQNDRKFLGIELKESYFKQAVANLKVANRRQQSLQLDAIASG